MNPDTPRNPATTDTRPADARRAQEDPARHAENDDAPFERTSERAAAQRQGSAEPASRPGEDAHATDRAVYQSDDEVAATTSVTRAHASVPVRPRRAEEANPELDKHPRQPRVER